MKPDKLPETPQEWMQADAVKHVQKIKSVRQRQATYLAYIAGATTWAQWKVKHDELQKENDRLNESCNKLFKQSCQFNNDLVDVRAQAQRMAYALEMTIQHAKECEELYNISGDAVIESAEAALQQFKDGKGKERPCPHCGKELSRDRNLCCRACGKEVGNDA